MMTLTVSPDSSPMNEMNTTPLIDVMLVLLIMIIMTMPVQSHAVKLDLPVGPPPRDRVNRIKNKLVITHDDRLLWNGEAISRPQLSQTLQAVAQHPQQPELQMHPEPTARYALVDEILADTKRAQVTRLGFIGNESYKAF